MTFVSLTTIGPDFMGSPHDQNWARPENNLATTKNGPDLYTFPLSLTLSVSCGRVSIAPWVRIRGEIPTTPPPFGGGFKGFSLENTGEICLCFWDKTG